MNLKKLQKKGKKTIKDTAKELDIAFSTYNQYLMGYREPNIKMLIKLANYFNVSIDELVGREEKSLIETPEKKQLLEKTEQLTEIECYKLNIFANGLITNRVAEQKTRTLEIINKIEKED